MSATLLNVQVRDHQPKYPPPATHFGDKSHECWDERTRRNTGLALNWELVHVSSPATVKNPVVHRCWIRPVCDGRYVIGGHTEN